MATILDGKLISGEIKSELKLEDGSLWPNGEKAWLGNRFGGG